MKILIDDNNLPSSFESEIYNQLKKQIDLYQPYYFPECEVLKIINLDIRLGDKLITDKFEWDVNNPMNKPEDFAVEYCRDLNLGSEFMLPIAHSIREQILEHRKLLINDRNFMGEMRNKNLTNIYPNIVSTVKSPEESKEVEKKFNLGIFREYVTPDLSDWQPSLKTLSQAEIQKYEQKEERKIRYAKRWK